MSITLEQAQEIKNRAIETAAGMLEEKPKIAEIILAQLLKIDPEHPSGLQLLGLSKYRQGKNLEAVEIFQAAIDIDPHNSDNFNNIGLAYSELQKYERAIEYSQKAIAMNPDKFLFYNNLALQLRYVGRHEDAVQTLKKAIRICHRNSPESAQLWTNLGGIHGGNLDLEKSIECFNRALECNPSYPAAHVDLAFAYHLKGEWKKGFEEYEWRKEYFSQMKFYKEKYDQEKIWDGSQSLQGKKILIYAEQGLGDAIQFMRWIPKLKEQGAYVIVHCNPSLGSMFSRIDFIDELLHRDIVNDKGDDFPEYDFQCCMMSLPFLLKSYDIHGEPYIEPATNDFKQHIDENYPSEKKKVGIVWAGSPAHPYDQHRSIPLKEFKILQDDVQLFGLQLDKRPRTYAHGKSSKVLVEKKTIDFMEDCEDMKLVDLTNIIQSFEDTCTILAGLDLVICCDTSIAHLAGAMGVPCYICVARNPDWRWKAKGDSTPWYNSVKIFRQTKHGNWSEVLESIRKELNENLLQN